MLKVNIMLYMNHVTHHIETPPGLTPPRLLAGGWEGKVLYVDSQHYIIYEPRDSSYVESQYLELRRTKMSGVAGVQNIQFWDNTEMVIFTALSNNCHQPNTLNKTNKPASTL